LKTLNVGGLYQLQYGYDNVGNILSWTSLYTAPNTFSESMQFQYDALDRLTRAISVTNGYTGTFAYDPLGNLLSMREGGAPITYTYGVTQPHAVRNLSNGGSYLYDLNGNLTRRVENGVTYTQTWDGQNRLVAVTSTVTAAKPVSRFTYG
jgi:YD repeat-containing protein